MGYECLEWGIPCTPLCGNGHIEVYEEDGPVIDVDTGELEYYRGDPKPVIPTYDADGNFIELVIEQCDFGGTAWDKYNQNHGAENVDPGASDYYKHPCDSNC